MAQAVECKTSYFYCLQCPHSSSHLPLACPLYGQTVGGGELEEQAEEARIVTEDYSLSVPVHHSCHEVVMEDDEEREEREAVLWLKHRCWLY